MNDDILPLLLSGKYLPAIGLILIALVGATRAGLGSFYPWFKTKVGGYVLGYGSAALLYAGAAWRDGTGLTLGVLTGALAAGWAAAGGWEHARDVLDALRGKGDGNSADSVPRATVVTLGGVAALVAMLGLSSCGPVNVPPIVRPVVECVEDAKINELLASWIQRLPSFGVIRDEAIAAGVGIGGCAFAKYVDRYLAPAPGNKAPLNADGNELLETFATYRQSSAGGASFKFADGVR